MPSVFVAKSDSLQTWASDVGLTVHVYKLGLSPESDAEAVAAALDAESHAGRTDWRVLAIQEVPADTDEAAVLGRVARKEKVIDPLYYPQIRKAPGILKVKLANVENHYLVREALEGQMPKRLKVTPVQVAGYLLRMAAG